MFDYTNLNTTIDTMVEKVNTTVDTAIATSEDNTKKMVGYIQDQNFRTVAETYADAGFALTRAMVDANRTVAETMKKAFTA